LNVHWLFRKWRRVVNFHRKFPAALAWSCRLFEAVGTSLNCAFSFLTFTIGSLCVRLSTQSTITTTTLISVRACHIFDIHQQALTRGLLTFSTIITRAFWLITAIVCRRDQSWIQFWLLLLVFLAVRPTSDVVLRSLIGKHQHDSSDCGIRVLVLSVLRNGRCSGRFGRVAEEDHHDRTHLTIE
jgi:hypothetical protein